MLRWTLLALVPGVVSATFTRPFRAAPSSAEAHWDLRGSMRATGDAFFQLMDPVLRSNLVAYCGSAGPDFGVQCRPDEGIPAEYAGGGNWTRVLDLETASSTEGGPHAVVFRDDRRRLGLVAIRGSCMDGLGYDQCNRDMCFLTMKVQGFGPYISPLTYGADADLSKCDEYERAGQLNYYEQAEELVRSVASAMPGHDLLLTGHSMGAMLAMVVAYNYRPNGTQLKALTVAPTPYYHYMKRYLNWTDERFQRTDLNSLYSTGDAFDVGINAVYAENARLGSTTCLFLGIPEPEICTSLLAAKPYVTEDWRDLVGYQPESLLCKGDSHYFPRYYHVLHRRFAATGQRAVKVQCSTAYSMRLKQ